jgi:hypothetical protein
MVIIFILRLQQFINIWMNEQSWSIQMKTALSDAYDANNKHNNI